MLSTWISARPLVWCNIHPYEFEGWTIELIKICLGAVERGLWSKDVDQMEAGHEWYLQGVFETFIDDLHSGIDCTKSMFADEIECTYNRFADDIKLSGVSDTTERRDATPWEVGLRKCNEAQQSQVQCFPLCPRSHAYRLELLESRPVEKDFRVLVNENMDINQQGVLSAMKNNCILDSIKRIVASRLRKVIVLLCPTETPSGIFHPRVPRTRRMELLKWVQRS